MANHELGDRIARYRRITESALTRAHIEQLRAEAVALGDISLARAAEAALDGSGGRDAIARCLDALNERRQA